MDLAFSIIGQALVGWLLADLLGGVVHWWQDRLARCDWPLIGQSVIAPNRLHHVDVLAFTHAGPIARNLATWTAVSIIALAWLILLGPSIVLAFAVLGGLVTSEVHRLAHMPLKAGPIVLALQETGVLQSPRHHAGHHRAPLGRRYCILTDWLNPLLDRGAVWSRLETGLTRVGLQPNGGTL